jgi:multimeric flavodoxin WrbA
MKKVLLLCGSPRKENVYYILNEIKKGVEQKGGEAEIIDVTKAMMSAKTPFCIVCSQPCNGSCYKGTLLEEAYDKMLKADFIVFGSPTYFGDMSAQMKALFDKSRGFRGKFAFLGKRGAAVAVSASPYGGTESVIHSLHNCMMIHGMTICNSASKEYGQGHFGICGNIPIEGNEFIATRVASLVESIFKD